MGGEPKDSLLTLFRHLAKLRQAESFQFGLLQSGYCPESNLFWFIREASGHRGYVVRILFSIFFFLSTLLCFFKTVFNLNDKSSPVAHASLYELTQHDVPSHIHYEYQWPKAYLPTSNKTHIDSNNLLFHPQSINIFWWTPKLEKPNILKKKAEEHSHSHSN